MAFCHISPHDLMRACHVTVMSRGQSATFHPVLWGASAICPPMGAAAHPMNWWESTSCPLLHSSLPSTSWGHCSMPPTNEPCLRICDQSFGPSADASLPCQTGHYPQEDRDVKLAAILAKYAWQWLSTLRPSAQKGHGVSMVCVGGKETQQHASWTGDQYYEWFGSFNGILNIAAISSLCDVVAEAWGWGKIMLL